MAVRADLSAPLLPSVVRKDGTAIKHKALSYPFSQAEVLADVRCESGLLNEAHSHRSALEVFSAAVRRLAPGVQALELGTAVRAAVYQRSRPDELVVPEAGPSWQQVAMIIASVLVGAGVLGLPYAFRMVGWAALPMIVGSTAVAAYTCKMLVWSFNTLNERKRRSSGGGGGAGAAAKKGFVATYDQLSEEIGGSLAGSAMRALTIVECYGCAVCYVVLHATSWPHVLELPPTLFGGVPAPVVSVGAWALMMAPLMMVKVRHLAIFGPLAIVAIATLVVVAVVAPLLADDPSPDSAQCAPLDSSVSEADAVGARALVRSEGVGVALGLILFCFGGHATLPDIYARMPANQREHFGKAVDVGCATAGALYSLLGAVGYFFYGGCAADALTLNLMHSAPTLGKLATVCVLANTFLTFPNFCAPVVRILSEGLQQLPPPPATASSQVAASRSEAHERTRLATQLQAIAIKVDAIGEALGALVSRSKLSLPEGVTHTLHTPLAMSCAAVAVQSGGTADGAVGAAGAPQAAAESAPPPSPPHWETPPGASGLFAAMSLRAVLLRLVLVGGAAVLAVTVPNFGFVVALMGAFTTSAPPPATHPRRTSGHPPPTLDARAATRHPAARRYPAGRAATQRAAPLPVHP